MPDYPFDRASGAYWSPPVPVFECAVRATTRVTGRGTGLNGSRSSALRGAVQAWVVVAVMVLTVIGPSAPSFAGDESDATTGSLNVRPWIEIGGVAGDRDDGSSRLETSVFAPLSQDMDTLFFTQMDGRFFTNPDAREGNFAFGLRHVADDVILGGFLSYDGRYSQSDDYYDQVTLGGELLTERFDIRANGYLPLADEKHVTSDADILLTNTSISMVASQGYDVPLWGVDGEVSARLFESTDQKHQLWAGIGGYYFDSRDGEIDVDVFGPRGRLEYRFDSPDSVWGMTLSGSVSDDDMRGTRYEAGIRLRWMLSEPGERETDPLLQRLSDRIYRDPDIVIGGRTVTGEAEAVRDTLTGLELERVAWASDSADLGAAVGAAAANTLLIVDQDYTDQQTIDGAENITIAGEQGTFSLTGVTSGTVVDYTVPGTRRSINVSVTADNPLDGALRLEEYGENVHLAGLDVRVENLTMTGKKEPGGLWQRLYGINVEGSLANPLYLEDLKGRAEAELTTATTVYGNVEALHITSGDVTVLDSDLSAQISQKVGAQIEQIHFSSYALRTGTKSSQKVTVENSVLSSRIGDLSVESATNATVERFVAGLSADNVVSATVRGSRLTASSGAINANATGTGSVTIYTHGAAYLTARGLELDPTIVELDNNTFIASITGNHTGTTDTGDISYYLDWLAISNLSNAPVRKLTITDNKLSAGWAGTFNLSTNGGIDTEGYIDGIYIGATLSDGAMVDVSGNAIEMLNTGKHSSTDDFAVVGMEVTANGNGASATVILANNSFTGDMEFGLLLDENGGSYTFIDSTGNTIDPNANVTNNCKDNGFIWAGEFELDGVTYDAVSCID